MDEIKNEIVKASVKNDRCEVSYKKQFVEGNYNNEVNEKCPQIVHSDLKKAFNRLVLHLIMVCEQPEAGKIDIENIHEIDLEEFHNYVVTGYSIGGSDESAGVTIIGQKLLRSGQVLNLISPFIKFEDSEAYSLAGELYSDIQGCDCEVCEYMFNGKWGIKQTEFEFDTPTESGVEMEVSVSDGSGEFKKVNMKKLKKLAEMNVAV